MPDKKEMSKQEVNAQSDLTKESFCTRKYYGYFGEYNKCIKIQTPEICKIKTQEEFQACLREFKI